MNVKERRLKILYELIRNLENRPSPDLQRIHSLLREFSLPPDIRSFTLGGFIPLNAQPEKYHDPAEKIRALFMPSPLSLFFQDSDTDAEITRQGFTVIISLMRAEYRVLIRSSLMGSPGPDDFPIFAAGAVLESMRLGMLEWYGLNREACGSIVDSIFEAVLL